MFEQAYLQEQVDELIAKTQQAAAIYQQLADDDANPRVQEQLAKLSREKQRHILLAERLREILD